jgi:hypothetical protein
MLQVTLIAAVTAMCLNAYLVLARGTKGGSVCSARLYAIPTETVKEWGGCLFPL